jgi:disulfide oxidoreductase YuzD
MDSFTRVAGIALLAFGSALPGLLRAQVNVTTYHNDNARTGQNIQEIILNPQNVNSSQFGKLFTVTVVGYVYAQPLYLSNVPIQGGVHNVVYIATEHDFLYAIDADNGTIYWQKSLLPAGVSSPVTNSATFNCGDLVPEVGISGTPAIDANTGTLYVVASSLVNGKVFQYLHAIDVQTSAEKFGGPVNIQGSAPGTAEDGNGSSVSFNAQYANQRSALLLENGHVVIAWSSHCDIDPWHGWIMSYAAGTLAQEGVFNPSAASGRAGIWMSGSGLAADSIGNIFAVTGNGAWNGTTDFGDSILKLGPPNSGTFPVLDYFTPYNQGTLFLNDTDVASGGLVLFPALPSGRQLLAQMGKEGKIYLVDRNNMGKNCAAKSPACSGSDPQIVQEIPNATPGIWGAPAYWNGTVYWGGASQETGAPDALKAFSLNANGSGLLSTTPTSKSVKTFVFSAPIPSISANGAANGILWGLDNSAYNKTCNAGANCQVLYAYDAGNLANMLYNSGQAANNRDVPGSAIKFAVPTIANGKVYVAGKNAVSAFGLSGNFVAAAPNPNFSPPAGGYLPPQKVSLSDTVKTAAIHFTVDGTIPTAASPVYGGPLQLTQTTTIRAIAVASGYANSGVAAATYAISTPTNRVPVNVDLTASGNVYAIFSDGTPVTNGGMTGGYAYSANLLGPSLTPPSGVTFNFGSANVPNAVNSTILALPAGNFSTIQWLGAAVQGSHVGQVFVVTYTDGTTNTFTQSMSDWGSPQHYPGETIVFTMPYRLRVQGPLYLPTYLYGYSFAINSAKTVRSLTLPTNRDIVILSVALSSPGGAPPLNPAPSPTFSLSTGSFNSPQTVSLSDTVKTAAIHYTTDGTIPTATSPMYIGPLTIAKTTTIRAIAVASGYTNSGVAAETYTITSGTGNVPVAVNLSAVYNVNAIFSDGTPVTNRGMDTNGYAYSANLLGPSLTPPSGVMFNFGSANVPNAVSSTILALPAGNFSTIQWLGAAVQGNHTKQTFVVAYTDGTADSFSQGMSDWGSPQNYPGETIALSMPYRLRVQGPLKIPTYLYGYSFAINKAKTVKSITPPTNRDIVLLSIDLLP